jgi:uncharacterized protein YigA (DUF484 family)
MMKPEEVAKYLKEHPEFFENHAEALAEITIPHPHGGRAIPISERQTLTLREKNRQLEGKLREVIQFGEENDTISAKVHRISVALLGAADLTSVLSTTYLNLREDFAVPHVAVRVWRAGGKHGELPEFKALDNASRDFVSALAHPHCGAHATVDTAGLFGDAGAHLKSFSYIPLRDTETFGLLTLASEDAQRFYPEMGTLYLTRLGDLVGSSIARHLRFQ